VVCAVCAVSLWLCPWVWPPLGDPNEPSLNSSPKSLSGLAQLHTRTRSAALGGGQQAVGSGQWASWFGWREVLGQWWSPSHLRLSTADAQGRPRRRCKTLQRGPRDGDVQTERSCLAWCLGVLLIGRLLLGE